MNASVKQLSEQQSNAPLNYDKLVGNARNRLLRGLDELFSAMLDGADDTLFTLAEKADNNQMQQVYFETMRMLRLERTNIKDTFAEKLTDSLQPGFCPPDENAGLDFDEEELTLVDQDSMEEIVAITGMYTKAMQMYRDELLHLAKRLEAIGEHTTRVFPTESVEPKNICEAFRDALAPVNEQIEIQNRLILYKLFDNKLIANLGNIYGALNSELAGAGVLPKITVKQLMGRQSVGGGIGGNNAHPVNPYEAAVEYSKRLQAFDQSNYSQYQNNHPEALDYESVRVLSNFLQQSNGGQLAPPPSPENHFSTTDVLQGLSMLQSAPSAETPLSAQEIKNLLIRKISTTKGGGVTQQVSQLDEKTIDLIQMLFDAMTQDDSVPDIIKSLLLRLQIPVIKSAMLDAEFFTNPHHPSRNLLSGLAETGAKISGDDDELVPHLEEIVDELVENFDQDVVSFQRAFDQLNATLHEEEVKARKAEARTQRQVLRDHARVIVLKELKDQVRGRNFPQGAHRLVLKNWSTVMYHRYIKHGKDSDQWFASVDILTEIIESLQILDQPKSSDAISAEFDAITEKLERELLNSKLEREEALDSLDELKEVYSLLLEKRREDEERERQQQAAIAENSKVVDDTNDAENHQTAYPEESQLDDDDESVFELSGDEALQITDDVLSSTSVEKQTEEVEDEHITLESHDEDKDQEEVLLDAHEDVDIVDEEIELIELDTEVSSIASTEQDSQIAIEAEAVEIIDDDPLPDNVKPLPSADIEASKVFPEEVSEFDLTGESAEDIATAMALGLNEILPDFEMEATGEPLASDDNKSTVIESLEEDEEIVEISLDEEEPVDAKPAVSIEKQQDTPTEPATAPINVVPPTEEALPVQDSDDFLPELSEEEKIVAGLESVDAYEPETKKSDAETLTPPVDAEPAAAENKAAPIKLRDKEDQKPVEKDGTSRKNAEDAHKVSREKDLQAESKLWKLLPNEIKPGVWINLYTGYREPEIRAKLSVIIPETETLIFVDRAGFKSAEKGLEDFLTELEEGLSSVVVEHSVFDKALSSVISNLSAY